MDKDVAWPVLLFLLVLVVVAVVIAFVGFPAHTGRKF